MSRISRINGDYRIQVTAGGNVILDTSNTGIGTMGTVTVYGNLNVIGTVTYVASTNVEITDNIIKLNYGQTGSGIGNGVGSQTSGIEIERGVLSPAQILFNETVNHYNPVTSSEVAGTFVMRTADGTLSGLQVASIANSGTTDFVFDMQNTGYVLRVANASSYATNISSVNDIPNVQYLNNYVSSTYDSSYPYVQGVALVDRIIYPPTNGTNIGNANSSIETFSSSIVFQVSQTTIASIATTGLNVNNINLFGNTVTNTSSNNLILTATNNNVEVNGVLNLDNQTWNSPSYPSSATMLYASNTIGPGKTGLYFTNAGAAHTPDELISRNRAVVLSILL
jgi:hypothetical protein